MYRRAIDAEMARQRELLENGEEVVQATRRYDETQKTTILMRKKEGNVDYKFFPEPNIPPIRLDAAWIKDIQDNMEELPEEIKDVATSILLQTGKRVKRSQLIGAVMESYEKYYNVFMESGNMSGLLDVYNSHLANMQRSVRVLQPGSEYVGTALGINDAGELLVKTEDGAVHQVISGEVSVRGIYGYV